MRLTHSIDPGDAPKAFSTSWAVVPGEDIYVLVLENEAGDPIACASYSAERWAECFEALGEILAVVSKLL